MSPRLPDGPLFKATTQGPINPVLRGVVLTGKCKCGEILDRVAYRDGSITTRPWTAFGYRCSGCGTLYIEEVL